MLITLPFPREQFLDNSKLNTLADNNFEIGTNILKLSGKSQRHSGKRRHCFLQSISPCPTVFSKAFLARVIKIQDCSGKDKPSQSYQIVVSRKLWQKSLNLYQTISSFMNPEEGGFLKHFWEWRNCW